MGDHTWKCARTHIPISQVRELVEAATDALWAIKDELMAAGDDEVKQHATLRSHARTHRRLEAALAKWREK